MDKNKIISLEKEIKKQQRIVKEFTQQDINELTTKGMESLAETVDTLREYVSRLFEISKLTIEATQQNKERIEVLEKKYSE